MYILENTKHNAVTETMTGETLTKPLSEADDLTALMLRFSWTADSSQIDATKERIADWITGITIVGDTDKYVLNARALSIMANYFYKTKMQPQEYVENTDGSINTLELPILFGNNFGDKDYFLKGGQFEDLELNITTADTDTGNFFDAGTVDIIEYALRENSAAHKGTMRFSEISAHKPAGATNDLTLNIGSKYPITKLLILPRPSYSARTTALTSELATCINKLKLTFKGGGREAFDDDIERLWRRNAMNYGLAHTSGVITGTAADMIDTGIGYVSHATIDCLLSQKGDPTEPYLTKATTQKQVMGTDGSFSDCPNAWDAWGYAYLDSVVYDFCPFGDMDYLVKPSSTNKIALKTTFGSVSVTQYVSIEEILTSL